MYMACMYCTCVSIPSTCMYECIIYYITQVCTPMLMYINLPSTIIENKHYLLSFICRAVRLNVAIYIYLLEKRKGPERRTLCRFWGGNFQIAIFHTYTFGYLYRQISFFSHTRTRISRIPTLPSFALFKHRCGFLPLPFWCSVMIFSNDFKDFFRGGFGQFLGI